MRPRLRASRLFLPLLIVITPTSAYASDFGLFGVYVVALFCMVSFALTLLLFLGFFVYRLISKVSRSIALLAGPLVAALPCLALFVSRAGPFDHRMWIVLAVANAVALICLELFSERREPPSSTLAPLWKHWLLRSGLAISGIGALVTLILISPIAVFCAEQSAKFGWIEGNSSPESVVQRLNSFVLGGCIFLIVVGVVIALLGFVIANRRSARSASDVALR